MKMHEQNLWWGDKGVQRQKGIAVYGASCFHCYNGKHTQSIAAVSPFRQRAAHNLIRGYIFNGYRRLASHVPYWILPFALGTYSTLAAP